MSYTKKQLAYYVTNKLQKMGYNQEIIFMDYSGYDAFSDIKWGKRGAYMLRSAYANDTIPVAITKKELIEYLNAKTEKYHESK
jgi:hypothetical protein